MPELAEAEFYRKRWHFAALGERIIAADAHHGKRPLRTVPAAGLRRAAVGAVLEGSEARAKQMLFRLSGGGWLGVHLGMTGELLVLPADHRAGRHDHLVLRTARHSLVFRDPRMFGKIELATGAEPPGWWTRIAPAIRSAGFTRAGVAAFLARRKRSPLKAVLLMQERFPGIGNWMADEILWRAGLHPARPAGSLAPAEVALLWRTCREVCRDALRAVAGPDGSPPPPDLNVNIPDSWLFHHRWSRGGRCPRTGRPLVHATIGGRTTCWCPDRQRLPAAGRRPRP